MRSPLPLISRTDIRKVKTMSTGYNAPLHEAIDAKLASIVASSPTLPTWYEAWRRLGPQSSDEERLAVYQAIRNSGSLIDEAGFYLVSWQVDAIASRDAEVALRDLEDRMTAIERAHGLDEGDVWDPGEEPAEYEELRLQYERAWDELFAAKLEEHGERDMARLFRSDPEEFHRRSEAGRHFFHGPLEQDESEVPAWLDELVDEVAHCLMVESPMGPLGFWYSQDGEFWEVVVYPTPVELLGGAHDGAIVTPGFRLDLEQFRARFGRIDDFGWDALGLTDPDGPHVWIEGDYRGHDVFLRVLAQAPEGEDPGMKLDVFNRGRN